jgi:hypothetical protein
MALKITKQIGTNKGITSDAYLRIVNYSISKYGYLQLNIQMFLSEEQASVQIDQVVAGMECFNSDVLNMLKIPLTKTLTKTVEKTVVVQEESEKTIPIMNDQGMFTGEFKKQMLMGDVTKKMQVEEEYQVPDLSLIKGLDIFEFGYNALKTKLVETFGAENIIDC